MQIDRNPFLRYERFFPGLDARDVCTLGLGSTPLIPSRRIGPSIGLHKLFFKLENLNPTGSYKDRFASLAVQLARERGQTTLLATSSGNTGAALAAFCAVRGIKCDVFVTERAPAGKLVQMQAYGANVYRVSGMGVDSKESARISTDLRSFSAALDIPLCVSAYAVSPDAMEGIKTIAYELADQLDTIDHVVVPVGGGGLFVALARGFEDMRATRATVPRLHAVQPLLNDTVVTPWTRGDERARCVDTTTTISGLAVARDLDGSRALAHIRASNGSGVLVTDEAARIMQGRLITEEGILVEPAGAVSVAGLVCLVQEQRVHSAETVVCILTGHSFKDPVSLDAAAALREAPLVARSQLREVLSRAQRSST